MHDVLDTGFFGGINDVAAHVELGGRLATLPFFLLSKSISHEHWEDVSDRTHRVV